MKTLRKFVKPAKYADKSLAKAEEFQHRNPSKRTKHHDT